MVDRTEVVRIVERLLLERFGLLHRHRIAGLDAGGGAGPAPDPWHEVESFGANFAATGGAHALPAYRLVGDEVRMRGQVTVNTGSASGGDTIFTLPEGYRPPYVSRHVVARATQNNSSIARINVHPDGRVTWETGTGSSNNFALDGIRFEVS